MDSAILRYRLIVQNIRTVLPNLLSEIILRVLLLFGVILMHMKYQPQAFYIMEAEMLVDYKKPRKESYVPPWAMLVLIIFVPLILFCLPILLARNYAETVHALLGWTLALLLNASCTELLKLIVLRPRPDFFYRCFPTGTESLNLHCIGNERDVIEGRKSFPSGHSSFAFCSLGFLSLWLNRKLRAAYRNLRMEIFCLFPLVVATFIGVSRCWDNHHHWQDVMAGAVLGFISSSVCYEMYCKPSNHVQ